MESWTDSKKMNSKFIRLGFARHNICKSSPLYANYSFLLASLIMLQIFHTAKSRSFPNVDDIGFLSMVCFFHF